MPLVFDAVCTCKDAWWWSKLLCRVKGYRGALGSNGLECLLKDLKSLHPSAFRCTTETCIVSFGRAGCGLIQKWHEPLYISKNDYSKVLHKPACFCSSHLSWSPLRNMADHEECCIQFGHIFHKWDHQHQWQSLVSQRFLNKHTNKHRTDYLIICLSSQQNLTFLLLPCLTWMYWKLKLISLF